MTMINIQSGELRCPIEVQRFTHKMDEQGFPCEEWTTIYTPRCKIEFDDRLIRQVIKQHGVNATSSQIFIFRKPRNLELTVQDKILYRGKSYEIYAIENMNEEDRFLKVWGRTIW